MSAKDFMPRHCVHVSIEEMEVGTCLDAPSDKEVRADALECSRSQVDLCPGQQDAVDLCADGQDTNFLPSGEKLSRQVSQLESQMKGKDRQIREFRGTVDDMAVAVAKRRQMCLEVPS